MEISPSSHQVHGAEVLWMNGYFELANGKKVLRLFFFFFSLTKLQAGLCEIKSQVLGTVPFHLLNVDKVSP